MFNALVVFVNDGEADEVLDGAGVRVGETLAVFVFDGWVERLGQGLLEEVFELVVVPVVVLVDKVERVDVVEPVIVLV